MTIFMLNIKYMAGAYGAFRVFSYGGGMNVQV